MSSKNFNPIFGIPVKIVTTNKQEQARKHRKKRINKKYLKKYGYKQIETHYLLDLRVMSEALNPFKKPDTRFQDSGSSTDYIFRYGIF